WAKGFEASQKIAINYDSVGSGEGVKRISGRLVDFGASDTALSNEELRKLGLIQIPTLIGGIVPVVNLPGVPAGSLRLTGDVLARIYLGKIGTWDHPDIRALNPGLSLPRLPIQRVVRSDNSGSTKSYTAYLAGASPQWAAAVGAQALPKWPADVVAAKGSEGVRDTVAKTPGALGYIGYNYVAKDKLNGVQLKNRAGRFVAAGEIAFAEAVNASGMRDSVSGPVSLIDREGAGSWPITETTYVLFERQPRDQERAKAALRFFYWAFQQGDDMARNTGFIPLPTQIQSRAVRLFSEVRDGNGGALNFF
ncbi:MAG TPA: phosphate ABC transporter substrate-binding protein PstS, partial [Rhodocyclaceae bacterium]|nr:phosphate ABC transporter substrate-binding protein PstS [Rhodocyclaceae bacterium]